MTLDECYQANVGKALLIPGGGAGNEGQCVQWADTVLHDVYGLDYHWGNAIDWWNSPGELLNSFDKVTDGSVKKGDFVVFNTQVGSVYGHIDVAMQDGSTSNFQGADSNWGGNKTVHLVQHTNSNYVLGSLRLKKKGNVMYPNQGDLTNFHNRTNWPGHVPNSNDVAYWTTGTGNPSWSKGADAVWKDLLYEVSKYVLDHPPAAGSPTDLKPGIYRVN